MDKVKISIIVPVYNAEEYLDRCINSILDQEFPSFEVILVDDGSTDSSPLICDRYSGTDPRFLTLHQKNAGVSAARNAGLNLAQGEYVMFLDSDDALLPYAMHDMIKSMTDEDVVIGGYGIFVENVPKKEVKPEATKSYKGNDYPRFFQENIRRNCELLDSPWAKLFKRKVVGSTRFHEDLNYAEDKLFVFEILSRCSSVMTVSAATYGYYLRAESLGSDISSDAHFVKLRAFLPRYAVLISTLCQRFPSVSKVQGLYHNDLVGRYICRMLNGFATRESEHLNEEFLSWIYGMMDEDKKLGVFSLRVGQVPNIILYKRGKLDFSIRMYRFSVKASRFFSRSK
ncbi:MAG: glycosyltransferase family 2 protein [Bacteroidales bacterium]|nr:glycosyltransferase family 2 protein [Bacteroidales bacterium]